MAPKIAHVIGSRRSTVLDYEGRELTSVQVRWQESAGSWSTRGFDDFFHVRRAWEVLEFMVSRLDARIEAGVAIDEIEVEDIYRKAVAASRARHHEFS